MCKSSLQEPLKHISYNFFLTLPTSTFHNRVILTTTERFSIPEMSKTGVKKGKTILPENYFDERETSRKANLYHNLVFYF